MVGPTIDDDDRRSLYVRLAAGLVVVIALSGALTGIHAGGSPTVVAIAGLGSGVVGVLLVAYLARLTRGGRRR